MLSPTAPPKVVGQATAATCPFPDCGRVIEGVEVKRQAQAGQMGEQLYTVVFKRRIEVKTKTGKKRDKWVRGFRAPCAEDDNGGFIAERLAQKLPEWEALDLVPNEKFPTDGNDDRPIQYGLQLWRDQFSSRQLLCHGTSVEVFREFLSEYAKEDRLNEVTRAAFVYLALSFDKLTTYSCRSIAGIPGAKSWHKSLSVTTFP
jgi:adenine-specific DNA methylase